MIQALEGEAELFDSLPSWPKAVVCEEGPFAELAGVMDYSRVELPGTTDGE